MYAYRKDVYNISNIIKLNAGYLHPTRNTGINQNPVEYAQWVGDYIWMLFESDITKGKITKPEIPTFKVDIYWENHPLKGSLAG